jgi:beta-N-acetylhexosaminidase
MEGRVYRLMQRLGIIAPLVLASALNAVPAAPDAEAVESAIRRLTLRQQVSQLLFISFQGTAANADVLSNARDAGGLVFYAANIESPDQIRRLITAIRRDSTDDWRIPFLALDQEGGTVVRLYGASGGIPSAMALGATASPELARRFGVALATPLRDAGFSLNFAPVLDVSSGRNASLDRRRLHHQTGLVTSLGTEWIAGHRDAGIVAVAKHFPGHGGSSADSHKTLPVNTAGARTLWRRDLAPFRTAINQGLEAIMTAHIRVPALAENDRGPATMSSRVLTDLLRGDLRFDGIVISDEIRMQALSGGIKPAEAAIESLRAGADMVLIAAFPAERRTIFEAIVAAAENGRLPAERIEASLRRILRLKYRISQSMQKPPASGDPSVFDEIARRSVTVIGNARCVIPMDTNALGSRILYIGPAHAVSNAFRNAARVTWGSSPAADGEARIASAIRDGPAVIVFAADTENELHLARRIRASAPRTTFILLWTGDPYALANGPRADASILTYGRYPESIRTAMRVLTGEAVALGKLPVELPDEVEPVDRCAPRLHLP